MNGTLTIHVDGPYGRPSIQMDQYDTLVLIAGGIGITPFASYLNRVRQLHRSSPQVIYLLWIVPTEVDLLALEDFMFPLSEEIQATFYVSRASSDGTVQSYNGGNLNYKAGRPVWEDILKPNQHFGSVGVMACGPTSLVQEVQWHSHKNGFDFHKEIFQL